MEEATYDSPSLPVSVRLTEAVTVKYVEQEGQQQP